MWDLPGPEIKPASPALAGGFFTTEAPRKPREGFVFVLGTGSVESKSKGVEEGERWKQQGRGISHWLGAMLEGWVETGVHVVEGAGGSRTGR